MQSDCELSIDIAITNIIYWARFAQREWACGARCVRKSEEAKRKSKLRQSQASASAITIRRAFSFLEQNNKLIYSVECKESNTTSIRQSQSQSKFNGTPLILLVLQALAPKSNRKRECSTGSGIYAPFSFIHFRFLFHILSILLPLFCKYSELGLSILLFHLRDHNLDVPYAHWAVIFLQKSTRQLMHSIAALATTQTVISVCTQNVRKTVETN